MIYSMTDNFEQYFVGTRYKKKTDVQGDYFRYGLAEYPQSSYGQVVNNLIAEQDRMAICTNWDLDWKVRQYVIDNDGGKWQITAISKLPQEVNPQVMALVKHNPDTNFIITMIKVENVEELK